MTEQIALPTVMPCHLPSPVRSSPYSTLAADPTFRRGREANCWDAPTELYLGQPMSTLEKPPRKEQFLSTGRAEQEAE